MVVDRESQLIVADEVVNAESDSELLVDMVEEVRENLGEPSAETVGDAGYYSPNQLAKAEAHGLGVLVPLPETSSSQGRFDKSHFRYDESEDLYICPLGQRLTDQETRWNSHQKYRVRLYRCRRCHACAERGRCTPGRKGRAILKEEHDDAVARQREKQRLASVQKILRSRKSIVEPVFAQIKEHMGFRRWTVRGLEKVRAQWSMICTAHNLKKLYPFWREGKLLLAQ